MDSEDKNRMQGLDASVQSLGSAVDSGESGSAAAAQANNAAEAVKPGDEQTTQIVAPEDVQKETSEKQGGEDSPAPESAESYTANDGQDEGNAGTPPEESEQTEEPESAEADANSSQTEQEPKDGKDEADASSKAKAEKKKAAAFIRDLVKRMGSGEKQKGSGKTGSSIDIPKGECIDRVLPTEEVLNLRQLLNFEHFLPADRAEAIKRRGINGIAYGIAVDGHKTIDGIVLALIGEGEEEEQCRLNGDLCLKGAQIAGIEYVHTTTYRFPSKEAAMWFAVRLQCGHRKKNYMVLMGVMVLWKLEADRAMERRKRGKALAEGETRGSTDKVIGDALGVSATTVYKAKAVAESPEHCKKVLAGELTINSAYHALLELRKANEGDPDEVGDLTAAMAAAAEAEAGQQEATVTLPVKIIANLFNYLYQADYQSFISMAKECGLEAAIPLEIHVKETMRQSA